MFKGIAFFLSFILAMISPPLARAGALLMPEGEGQEILTTTFADANDAYDPQGRLVKTPSYRKFEAQSYVEYGAADWLTVVGEAGAMDFHGSVGQASLAAPQAPQYEGLGLGEIGARVGVTNIGDYIFSLQTSIRAASSRNAQTFLDMKDRWQGDARLQMFHAIEIGGMNGFIDAELGYRTRGQNGDEAHVDLTFGIRPTPDLMFMAQSFTAISLWHDATNSVAAQKFEVSVVYDLNKTFSVQLGFVDAPMGANSPAERGIISALWTRF